MPSPSATPTTSDECSTHRGRPCKRRKLEDTPETDSDESYGSYAIADSDDSEDDNDEAKNLVEILPDDVVGAIFFGGYVDSLEVLNNTSCLSKGAMKLAETQVKMLDLRKCSKLKSAKLSFLVNRFPQLEVRTTTSSLEFISTRYNCLHCENSLVLQVLDLGYCRGIRSISKLQNLRSLKILKLSGTCVTAAGIRSFLKSPAARRLEELDLSVVNELQKCDIRNPTVKLLAVRAYPCCEPAAATLILLTYHRSRQQRCPNLRSLKLAWCTCITDAAIAHLSKLQGLVELDLQLTSITSEACKILSKLTSLKKLDLSACSIGSSGLIHLLPESPRSKLEELELRFNVNLNEASLKLLMTRAPKLKFINVQCCELTRDDIKSVFVPLQRLGVTVKMDRIYDSEA